MRAGRRFSLTLVVAGAGCGVPAVAQSWTPLGPAPLVSFGAGGDLVVRDQQGPVGFDEATASTLLRVQGNWVALPAAPAARTQSTIVSNGQRIYLFGGVSGQGPSNDVWRFDWATSNWTPMQGPSVGIGPAPRYGAKAVSMGGGWPLLVFGGLTANGLANDTWAMIDLGPFAWWSLQPTPPGLVGRIGHAMAVAPEQAVVLFGGDNGGLLGDTWIWKNQSWSLYVGLGPPAARDVRMVYDPDRDMTVLLHPNGDVWEWNGLTWRRVGMAAPLPWSQAGLLYEPGPGGGVRALVATPAALTTFAYEPSPARSAVTFDASCAADPNVRLEMFAVDRTLPILGGSIRLRTYGVLPSSLFVGAFELAGNPPLVAMGCDCTFALVGTDAATVFVPGTGSERDWLLPIANAPALNGVPVDVQGILFDPAAPCVLMTTTRNTLWPGW